MINYGVCTAHGAVCTRIKNFEFWILTFDDFDNFINCLLLNPLDDTLCCGGVVVAGKSTDSLVKTKEHLTIVFNQFNWTISMKLLFLLSEYTVHWSNLFWLSVFDNPPNSC